MNLGNITYSDSPGAKIEKFIIKIIICKDPKSNWFLLDGITQRAFYNAINVMENERKKK